MRLFTTLQAIHYRWDSLIHSTQDSLLEMSYLYSSSMQRDPSVQELDGMCCFMQWLCYKAACFPVLMKTRASTCPTAGEHSYLVSSTVFACSCKLRLWQGAALMRETGLVQEVLSPEGPITGSSLGAVKLDNEEQREQQRRQRQVKASDVTEDKMCLPLCQFEVQVFKSCRLRSLILSAIMRGKSVRQLNEQFFFLIFKSKVTALLQSTPHWLFFVHLHCSVSPFKLPPVVRANFPIWCYTKD